MADPKAVRKKPRGSTATLGGPRLPLVPPSARRGPPKCAGGFGEDVGHLVDEHPRRVEPARLAGLLAERDRGLAEAADVEREGIDRTTQGKPVPARGAGLERDPDCAPEQPPRPDSIDEFVIRLLPGDDALALDVDTHLRRVVLGGDPNRGRDAAVDRGPQNRPEPAAVAGQAKVGSDVAGRVGGADVGDDAVYEIGLPAPAHREVRIGRGRLADIEVNRDGSQEADGPRVERCREHAVALDTELLHPGDDQPSTIAGADPRPARVEVLADVDPLRRAPRPIAEPHGEDMAAAVDAFEVDDAPASVLRHRRIGNVDHLQARAIDRMRVGNDRAGGGRGAEQKGAGDRCDRGPQAPTRRESIAHRADLGAHLCQRCD